MADPSALSDLDDVLSDLGFDDTTPHINSDQQENSEPGPRRGTVISSSPAASDQRDGNASSSRPVSTRVSSRNRQSNMFSATLPLGNDPALANRSSVLINPQSGRASVIVNQSNENSANTTERSGTATETLEAGNRRSFYDPDHLELPDFRQRDTSRPVTREIGIDTINSAFALQSMLGSFMGVGAPEEAEPEPEPESESMSNPAPPLFDLPPPSSPPPAPEPFKIAEPTTEARSLSPRSRQSLMGTARSSVTGIPSLPDVADAAPFPSSSPPPLSPSARASLISNEPLVTQLKPPISPSTHPSNYVVMPAMTSTHVLASATANATNGGINPPVISPGRPLSPSRLGSIRLAEGVGPSRGNRGSQNFTALRGAGTSSPSNVRQALSTSSHGSSTGTSPPASEPVAGHLSKSGSSGALQTHAVPLTSTTVVLASLTSSTGRSASSKTFSKVAAVVTTPANVSPRSSESGALKEKTPRALTVMSPRNELVDYKTQQQTAYIMQQQENLELLKRKKEEAEWQQMRTLTLYKRVKPPPNEPITCMLYADMRVIAGTRDGSVLVLDANAGDLVEYKQKVHGGQVTALAQVGAHLLSAADDGTICVWERKSRSLLGDKDKQAATVAPFQTYRGWVTKQGVEVKNWKHRWLVLDQEELLRYYSKKEDHIPKGTINLVGASVEKLKDRDDKKEKRFYFSVGTKDRVFHMYANTDEERNQWADNIAAAIELSRTPTLSSAITRKMKRGVLSLTAVHAQAWIGCMEPVLHVWDTVTNARHELSINFGSYVPENALVTKLVWSKTRAGALLVWAAVERALVRFDVSTMTQLDCLAGAHQHGITALANTGETVLSASRERLVMWHESGEAVRQFDLNFPLVYAILPLGGYIWVCGYNSANVEVLNVYDKDFNLQKELNEGKHHSEAITSLVVSNWDACWSASKDGGICIWR